MQLDKYIDGDILAKFEFYNYGHALEIILWQTIRKITEIEKSKAAD